MISADNGGYFIGFAPGGDLPAADAMDLLGFLRLRAWDAKREQDKKKPRQRFLDEVWPGVKP